MFYIILLIVLGVAACPSIIVSKKPEAKEMLDKLVPYQGWLGVILCVVGLWRTIDALRWMQLLSIIPLFWILWLAVAILSLVLGFIMGFGLINTYVLSRNPKMEEKGQQLIAKLRPLQSTLGLASIIVGIITLFVYLIQYRAVLTFF